MSIPPSTASTRAKAFPGLQGALVAAALTHGAGEILVAEGTRTPGALRPDTFFPGKEIGIHGGFAGAELTPLAADRFTYPAFLPGKPTDLPNEQKRTDRTSPLAEASRSNRHPSPS